MACDHLLRELGFKYPFSHYKIKGKLHFTTLNYTPKYTLHPKLFGCTVYTLNYDSCYTLRPSVSFTVKFDGNMKHVTFTCDLFKWDKCKRPKNPSS